MTRLALLKTSVTLKQRRRIPSCNLSNKFFHVLEFSGACQGVKSFSSQSYPCKLEYKNWKTLGNFIACVFITKHGETAKWPGTAHARVLHARHCCSASQGECIQVALRDCLCQGLCTECSSWHVGKEVMAGSGKRVSSSPQYSAQGEAGLQLLLTHCPQRLLDHRSVQAWHFQVQLNFTWKFPLFSVLLYLGAIWQRKEA